MRRTTSLVDGNAEGQGDLLRDPWAPPGRIPPFHVDDGGHDFLAGSLWAGLRRHGGREQQAIFPLCQRSMEAQEGGGFYDNRGTDQPTRAYEERTQPATMRSARRRWGERFRERLRMSSCCLPSTDSGHHGTRPARTGESGEGC